MGAALYLSLVPGLSAQGNKELVEALLENGQLTSEQAEQILDSGRPLVETAGDNFKDFRIRGRIQTQFGHVFANGEEDYSTLEMRRVRLGVRGTLLQNVRAQLEANLVPGSGFSMRSAFLQWREYEQAYVKVGFDRPAFGFERTTSSASIYTVERSNLTNTIISNDMTGVSMEGKMSLFNYGAGVYTNRDNRNPDGDSRYLYNGSVGVSLDHLLPDEQGLRFRGDIILNDDSGGNFGFKEGFSLSGHYEFAPFDLRAEYLHANDFNGDSTYGWYVSPSYFLTEKFQITGRYEWMKSDNNDGITSPGRYMRRSGDFGGLEGNEFQAIYAGANYYFNGDANKVMFGVEYAELDVPGASDAEAVTLYGAWRVLF